MAGYSHLSYWERQEIARLYAIGWSLAQIGAAIGRGKWTVSRELARNSNKDGSYKPESADRRYMARRRRQALLDRMPELARFVVERLNENWTPEQISGWLKRGNERGLAYICHEAIYAWIYDGKHRADKLWKLLPRHRAKRGFKPARKPHSTIKNRHSIHQRPQEVDARAEGGHWEGDLMICRRTRPVLVMTERKSRFTIVARLAGKTAAETAAAIMDVFARLHPALRRSITFDNGTEFAHHTLIAKALNMATWFCDAYASWQKGTVENTNGRLRRDLPRKLDIDKMAEQDLQDIVLMHNLTPRKCLSFKTPVQALLAQLDINAKISFNQTVALRV